MSDDANAAMLAKRRQGLDGAFKAVERVRLAVGDGHIEGLVVIIAALVAFRHVSLLPKKQVEVPGSKRRAPGHAAASGGCARHESCKESAESRLNAKENAMPDKDPKTKQPEAEYDGPSGADERYSRNQQYGQGDNAQLDRRSGDETETGRRIEDEDSIRDSIRQRLDQSGLDVANVEISVADDRITLDGDTMDESNRNAIEQCAGTHAGIRQVRNLIRIRRGVQPDLGASADSDEMSKR